MFADRKSSYKLPPTTIRDKLISQETRRNKALEEQKRRRAKRIDSARQLDIFAGLNLGASDDDDAEDDDELHPAPASVAPYAAMLTQRSAEGSSDAITSSGYITPASNGISISTGGAIPLIRSTDVQELEVGDVESKKRRKHKIKRKSNKPTTWADRCMYAELLEMVSDEPWSSNGSVPTDEDDCLPKDLETGWVALAPVPAGKRCLAVTHQSAGVAGIVPNTTLRSRLLGKTLIQRFPSSLPPLTILDCILDSSWRDNGILHILDVVKWKGQDVGDCEAGFRFWWRDTRLAELTQMLPLYPMTSSHSTPSTSKKYRFPYPTTFIPVPYHTNTTLPNLDSIIVPAARTIREIPVKMPLPSSSALQESKGSMDLVPLPPISSPRSAQNFEPKFIAPLNPPISSQAHEDNVQIPHSQITKAQIQPDGLLLYVAEASYEPGTSPLSSWVPIAAYEQKEYERDERVGEVDDRPAMRRITHQLNDGPLSLFQSLVRKRLARRVSGRPFANDSIGCNVNLSDIEMDM